MLYSLFGLMITESEVGSGQSTLRKLTSFSTEITFRIWVDESGTDSGGSISC